MSSVFDGAKRPVIILGGGVRLASAEDLVPSIMNIGVPVLTSWQGADLCDCDSPTYFGRPGVYGQRCANKVLTAADMVLSIGCRLSLWVVGYEGLAKDVHITMVDVDGSEVGKIPGARWIVNDLREFMAETSLIFTSEYAAWLDQCDKWKRHYPLIEHPTHDDTNGYINSYAFMERLNKFLKPNQVIVTDAGGACCSAFQVLQLKPSQRMLTSGGLGEMGCGIPMAVGASFARDKGEVLCLVGDGAAMMNLQELQTIAHHKLPVKILVFNNDGYGMIKATQKTMGYERTCVDKASGVSMPNFRMVAQAFGFAAGAIYTWDDFDKLMPQLMDASGPSLCEVFLDPEQAFLPKLNPIIKDGVISSPQQAAFARDCVKTYFITGGTGLIGRSLTRALLKRRDTKSILLLSRGRKDFLVHPKIRYLIGDINEVELPTEPTTHLIHAAAEANDLLQPDQAKYFYDIVGGAERIFGWALANSIKNILFISSGAVYKGDTLYCRGKRISEWIAERFELPMKIARVYSVVGEEMPLNGQYALGQFIGQAIKRKRIEYYGGMSIRTYLYIEDVSRWLLKIMDEGRLNVPYPVGSLRSIRVEDLAQLVGKLLRVPVVKVKGPPRSSIYVPDSDRTMRELSVRETVSLEEAIRRVYKTNHRHPHMEPRGKTGSRLKEHRITAG